jgi:hypothetical protein
MLLIASAFMSASSSNSLTYPPDIKTGNISAAVFKGQLGLIAWLDDFDFDASCFVNSFTLYYTPKRQDVVTLTGKKGKFSGKISQYVKKAKPGDQYAFVDVKVKCPGDKHPRPANSLYFKIR